MESHQPRHDLYTTPNLAAQDRCHEGCQVAPLHKPVIAEQLARADMAFLLVRGVACPACATRVCNGLLQINGVIAADMVLEQALHSQRFAKVWYDPQVLQPETIVMRLPAVSNDAHHHYTAHLVVISAPPMRMKSPAGLRRIV